MKKPIETVIDISRYNDVVDFSRVKSQGISGVIIRVGYRGYSAGNIKLDDKFESYIKGATSAGLKVGIYFMSQAITVSEAIAEAEFCVAQIKGYDISYPIAYDSEYSGATGNTGRADKLSIAQRTSVCRAFLDRVAELGYKSSTYSSKAWFSDHLDVPQLIPHYIWVAQYNLYCNYLLSDYDMWQYSSKGIVNGINGKVDMNEVYTDFDTAHKASKIQLASIIEAKSGIGTYSKAMAGNSTLSLRGFKTNFKVKEFACNDGSDMILIDVNLVSALQTIREHFGKSVSLNSGYRTATYNKKIGGAANSYHTKGQAADIKVQGVSPLDVCKYAESIGLLGVGQYATFTHIDTRDKKYFWNSTSGKETKVQSFNTVEYPTLRLGDVGAYVLAWQKFLKGYGLYTGTEDGIFSDVMLNAVKMYQSKRGLKPDGVIGIKTWRSLTG